MSKKKQKVKVEEVDVEALNAQAEDLIGNDDGASEEAEADSPVLPVIEPNVRPSSDSDKSEDEDQGDGAEVQSILLGVHPITGKKVYS